jgi:hypothetical protein
MTSSSTTKDESKTNKEEEPEQIHLSKKDYDALIYERDQAKVNLYLYAAQLKDLGFQVSEAASVGITLQRLGTDITNKLRLSPEQMTMIQRQIQQ